jgi:cytochrome c biogenesis protein ResB
MHKETGAPAAPEAKTARFLASSRLLYWLLPGLIVLSVAGTLIPQGEAPSWYANRFGSWAGLLTLCGLGDLYHSGLFTFLLGLLGLNLALCTWRRQTRFRLRPDVLLTHIAVLTILAGGMISGVAGRRGSLPLNVGESRDMVEGTRRFQLPFTVKLEDFRIEHYGSGRHRLTVSDRKSGWSETKEVQPGAETALRNGSVRVAVLDYYPDFVMDQNGPGTRSKEPANPALRLEITDAQGAEKYWAFARFPDVHMGKGSRYALAYELAAGQVKQFRSEIVIIENGWIAARRTVEVNKPLRWKGYSFYQAGYDPDNPGYSSLLVSRDPGVPVVYAGFFLLTAGLIWTFLRGLRRRP